MPFITPWKEKPLGSMNRPNRGVEAGSVENARTSLVCVLEERFGALSPDDLKTVGAIDEPWRLLALMRFAVKAPTLKDFLRETENRVWLLSRVLITVDY